METVHSTPRSWGPIVVAMFSGLLCAGAVVEEARAEGIVAAGFAAADGLSGKSLADTLGEVQAGTPGSSGRSETVFRVAIRRSLPQGQASRPAGESGGDIFRHSSLVLPLLIRSAADEAVEANVTASRMRPMTGPMVGMRSLPFGWSNEAGW